MIGANKFGTLLFEKKDVDGNAVGSVVGTDVPGYTHQFDPFPNVPGIFQLGEFEAPKLFLTDTPLLALLLDYCLFKLGRNEYCCVSLLPSSKADDILQIMSRAKEIHLILRIRAVPIEGHEKLVGIPTHAKTTNLGDPESNPDFFWTMIKDGCSGPNS